MAERVKPTQGGKYHHHHHHHPSTGTNSNNNKGSPPSGKPNLNIGGKRSASDMFSPSVPPLTASPTTIKRQKLQSSTPTSTQNASSLQNHKYFEQVKFV